MSPVPTPASPILPYSPLLPKLALIMDGEVLEVMAVSEKAAAALLSNPTIVDLGLNPERITEGDHYDATTGAFTKLEEVYQQQLDAEAAAVNIAAAAAASQQ